ncbi:atp-dependent helicase [Methylobacterium sp. NEAU 140]|uniref:atp-dependent helicase n=1 Tax=Methylobacterium sp. NEAU 140 TaxID=3064945 RepID=UPI002733FF16|nr:atp-dependent helicase [Methylobacterium sp. NEAU 140]MDP4024104.1 atp-dependent helicase [Methylobacterium sp. NEAU 140]
MIGGKTAQELSLLTVITEQRARYDGAFAREDRILAERDAARGVSRAMTRARDEILREHQAAQGREAALRDEIAGLRAALAEAGAGAEGHAAALAEAEARTEAVQVVLAALIASVGWRGLDRRRFRALLAEAARTIPDDGPAAVQHRVLLDEARKVLDLRA